MLHTTFHCNRLIGSGEEKFKVFLPYKSVATILVRLPRSPEQTFVPPPYGGSTRNLASISLVVLEKMFENVGDGRTDKGCLGILKAHLLA